MKDSFISSCCCHNMPVLSKHVMAITFTVLYNNFFQVESPFVYERVMLKIMEVTLAIGFTELWRMDVFMALCLHASKVFSCAIKGKKFY